MYFALQISLMGIGMVFFLLLLLSFSISLLGRLSPNSMESREIKGREKREEREVREEREERSVKRKEREDHETISGEIVAVIAATIAATMGREEKQVRILSIKSVPDKSWRRSYYSQGNHD